MDSLSGRVASIPRLASLLALALVLALSVSLPRPVLAQALAVFLVLSGLVVYLLLLLGRRLFALTRTLPAKLCFC